MANSYVRQHRRKGQILFVYTCSYMLVGLKNKQVMLPELGKGGRKRERVTRGQLGDVVPGFSVTSCSDCISLPKRVKCVTCCCHCFSVVAPGGYLLSPREKT